MVDLSVVLLATLADRRRIELSFDLAMNVTS